MRASIILLVGDDMDVDSTQTFLSFRTVTAM